MTVTPSIPANTHVAIVGGGLAGIAAAAALSQAGMLVTLLEGRQQLGGRATAYVDAESGTVIDNCQHVSMGCCTNLRHLCMLLQIEDAFRTETKLTFISPNGQQTSFEADPLPAPFHLSRAFLKLPYITLAEKWLFARGVRALAASPRKKLIGQSFATWLKEHGQSDQLIRRVWEVVLVSALSESLDRIDAAYAQKVFVDGFLVNRHGWQVEIPQVSLDELYSRRAAAALNELGVKISFQSRVTSVVSSGGRIHSLLLKDGREIKADVFVLAVPHHQLAPLLSTNSHLKSLLDQVSQIETAPITSVHLWFQNRLTSLPHAVLVDGLSQWVFSRGRAATPSGEGHLYQVVISASRALAGTAQADIIEQVRQELENIWPAATSASLLHSRIITEKRAVFSVTPGIDVSRPPQQTQIQNLQLAGDWTQTGWPSTMEGAVRSGFLAAENIFHQHGIHESPLQPELPRGWLARLLWGNSIR